ncbi:MAG TPA: RluA family pseudouridine synthase [Armatimonadota bacterium]|nr:RluA family pseudouridine synthase [Armatimonadota bacterium]HQK92540.1 RluA family pseudouridine synthase [Armatimonadota bacterium]
MRLEFPFDGPDGSERLDRFVSRVMPEMSRTRIQEAIRNGYILVHQNQERSSYRLRQGDLVVIALPPVDIEPVTVEPEDIPLDILYEDRDILVLNKQAGLVVHPAPGINSGTLVNALLYHFGHLSQSAGLLRPGIVHRLDKDTTGVMVVAKNNEAHDALSSQLAARAFHKVYAALVYGAPRDSGIIDAPIGRHPVDRTKMAIAEHTRRGREAITRYRTVERFLGMASVSVEIETGRTHQIRVHMTHVGHPVVGDLTYGSGRSRPREISVGEWEGGLKAAVDALPGQALHAESLSFTHPRTGKRLTLVAPWPESMERLRAILRAITAQAPPARQGRR